MTDERSIEGRIARTEACLARLEERIRALDESRREWRAEVERRLDENNNNARKLMEERTKDRAELVTTDLYTSRHGELKSLIDSHVREITSRESEHERDDLRRHEADEMRLKLLEEFKANLQGRLIATGAIAATLGTLAGWLFHLIK